MPLVRALTCLAFCCALSAAHAQPPQPKQDPQIKLRLDALLEEGRLLIQEFEQLEPTTSAVREEGDRLRDEEKQLGRESAEMTRAIEQHNRAANELTQRLRDHRQRCPKSMNDDAAIEACNARGAELVARGRQLDGERGDLAARQQELQRRITLFNSSQQAWTKVKRAHQPKSAVNEADANQWVDRAQAFTRSKDFPPLVNAAGVPAACQALQGWVPPAKPGIPGLKKLYACLSVITPK
jgi:chromosome segregation ATPase